MKRTASIDALLRKSRETHEDLVKAYQASLTEKVVREDLKVDIKNTFENLRSCLDYLAHELFVTFSAGTTLPKKLYFPIRSTAADFKKVMDSDFPGLEARAKPLYDFLESIQPYRDPWLGQFNRLNNDNKHQDLVEQSRTEQRHVKVTSPGGGTVSWGPGVRFGGGVFVQGVPIDPRTQMPVPNKIVQTTVTTWVDFQFRELGLSVLPFIQNSINRVSGIYQELSKYC